MTAAVPTPPAPISPAPICPSAVSPAPVSPAPVSPAPVSPAPVSPAPVSPAPVSPAPPPAQPGASGTSRLISTLRASRLLWLLLIGVVLTAATAGLRRLGLPCRWWPRLVCWWHGRLCRALGLRLCVRGAPAAGALLVANHVSWLDIPVLGSLGPLVFVSKAEVRAWPVVGWLAAQSGTLFIARGGHQTDALTARIRDRLDAGRPVVLFAEGTTGTGEGLRRFHPRLFAVAQQPGVRVQPVAVRYGSNARPDPIAPFVGDDSLLAHLPRVLRHPGLTVEVTCLAPIEPAGRDRRSLADGARAAIGAALGAALGLAEPPPASTAAATKAVEPR